MLEMYDFHSALHGCVPCKNGGFGGPFLMLDVKVKREEIGANANRKDRLWDGEC